jgi:hypothetical protein
MNKGKEEKKQSRFDVELPNLERRTSNFEPTLFFLFLFFFLPCIFPFDIIKND